MSAAKQLRLLPVPKPLTEHGRFIGLMHGVVQPVHFFSPVAPLAFTITGFQSCSIFIIETT